MPLRRLRTTMGASLGACSSSVSSCMVRKCNARKRKSRPKAACTRLLARSVPGLVDQLVLLDPRHHRAQLLADHLDLVFGHQPAARLQRRRAGAVLEDEALRVFARL